MCNLQKCKSLYINGKQGTSKNCSYENPQQVTGLLCLQEQRVASKGIDEKIRFRGTRKA